MKQSADNLKKSKDFSECRLRKSIDLPHNSFSQQLNKLVYISGGVYVHVKHLVPGSLFSIVQNMMYKSRFSDTSWRYHHDIALI